MSTSICTECRGAGYTTRWTVTRKTQGWLRLRYAPKEPRPCKCVTTAPHPERPER